MDFEKYINSKVSSRKILEIGGLGDFKKYSKQDYQEWRHKRLVEHASSVCGVDINKEGIEFVNKSGFNYNYLNLESTCVDNQLGKFDSILLLDVIEHLNNIGTSLDNIKQFMKDDAELIVSTPNPMAMNNVVRVLLGKKPNTLADHTVWLDETNVRQLAERYDYDVVDVLYFTFRPDMSMKQRAMNFFGSLNKYLHQNFVVVLKKK
jgi:SAM-dependent methyltransferase